MNPIQKAHEEAKAAHFQARANFLHAQANFYNFNASNYSKASAAFDESVTRLFQAWDALVNEIRLRQLEEE